MTIPPSAQRPAIPRTVWVLGLVSFFMDVSSEMIHALLPLFLTLGLGASLALVGLIEGVAEAAASIAKLFSGYLSDRIHRRKPLILLGYGLAALSKPLFALAGAPSTVFAARIADRVGKGVRGAPRDALVADVTPASIRGRAYGVRQALDTVGAFTGPLIAIGLMAIFANDMRTVFWFAVIPAAFAVVCVLLGVEERVASAEEKLLRPPIRAADLRRLDVAFWAVVAIAVVFTLARFSEAFLVLKANAEGLPLSLSPLVLIAMNIVYSLGAYPAGAWSDHAPPAVLMLWGLAALAAADLILAFVPGVMGAFAGIMLWGTHMALTQGLLAKLVAQRAPADLRGSAFGLFNLATGVTMIPASLMAGLLWQYRGPAATFLTSAAFAVLAAVLSLCALRAPRPKI
ncbi:MAG: MFS transporter [Alphaproteobacteria bacterium]|nr:MAG: MFS transporter [Alphaproteobacteria bacterium]